MNLIDILASPWAIVPDRLDELTRIYSKHLAGEKIDVAKLEAKAGTALQRKPQGYDVRNGVAIIPIDGIIGKKMNLFSQISGGASTQLIERDFVQAMDDPAVTSIILHADTPGGTVDGTAELSETIFKGRGQKPIYALADGLMASAGVWIGTAADKVFITGSTTQVGSIGVVTQHVDRSERERQAGIRISEIYAGRYKRIAGEHGPLSDEGREHLQGKVDYLYSIFVDTVARHRGTSTGDVLERMADGQLFIGQQAIDAGLADGVANLDDLVNTLAGRTPTSGPSVSRETAGISAEDRTAYEQGFAAGAAAELDRIGAVIAVGLPGHESLIESLILDGKTTGGEAAKLVLAAEKAELKTMSTRRQATSTGGASPPGKEKIPYLDVGQASTGKLKAKWKSNAGLRAEFEHNFDRFVAYERRNLRVIRQ